MTALLVLLTVYLVYFHISSLQDSLKKSEKELIKLRADNELMNSKLGGKK